MAEPNEKVYTLPGRKFNPIDNKLLRIIYENLTDEEKGLSPNDLARMQHLRIHIEHAGHDEMHAEMVLILFAVTIIVHVGLILWKKHNFKSYQRVSMFGVWLIPFGVCLHLGWWLFIFWWLLFTCISILVIKAAIGTPLDPHTPRQVYKWFLFVHKLCTFVGILGYVLLLAALFGISLVFRVSPPVLCDYALLMLFYGLYFGVLCRDLAEVCADKMASHIGYYKPEGMPTRTLEQNVCAICGNPQLVPVGEQGVLEDTIRLTCGHTFHEFCIRGWCIVGKKNTCPYCKEKVDTIRIVNYWEQPHVYFGQMIDWTRLCVAWQPLIIIVVQNINKWLDLK